MHETHQHQEQQGLRYPGVYEAAQNHWQALAVPAGLSDEFPSNYLGTWLDPASLAVDLARDVGLPDATGEAIVEQLHNSRELALVIDDHGVHVFVHPEGPTSQPTRTEERLRHLQLVPSVVASPPECPAWSADRGPDCA
jgi:hypothetical protein